MSDEIIRTAFDRVQRAAGGDLVDWEGWYWPNHFGDQVSRAPGGQDRRRGVGRLAAAQVGIRGPRRARGGRPDLHERHGRPRGRPGSLRAVLRREREDGGRRHGLQDRGGFLHRRDGARHRPRPLPRRRLGPGRGDRAADAGDAAARHQRPAFPGGPAEPHGRGRHGPRVLPLLAGPRATSGA